MEGRERKGEKGREKSTVTNFSASCHFFFTGSLVVREKKVQME